MFASWVDEGPVLVVTLSAPTTGWVAIGFNRGPELAGARLVMASVQGATALAEEHVAAPPEHFRVDDLRVRSAREVSGRTEVTVEVPRVRGVPGELRLDEASVGHLILAFSESDDFQHHSRMRVHLPRGPAASGRP